MTLRLSLGQFFRSFADAISPVASAALEPEAPLRPENVQETAIKSLLEKCARAFVPPGRHVRANVMVFTSNGARRKVSRATAFNMENDPDADLEIDATAAASGKAATERRAAVADLVLLRITAVPAWGLRAEQQARVRSTLQSVLSVPVFNPHDVDGPLLGTLQVDSDLTMEEAGFSKPESAELLQQFADVLSLLMIGLPVRIATAMADAVPSAPKSRVQNATQVEPGLYVANATTSIFQLSKHLY